MATREPRCFAAFRALLHATVPAQGRGGKMRVMVGQEDLQKYIEEGTRLAEHLWEQFKSATELPALPEALVLSPGFISVIAILLLGYLYFRVRGSH